MCAAPEDLVHSFILDKFVVVGVPMLPCLEVSILLNLCYYPEVLMHMFILA